MSNEQDQSILPGVEVRQEQPDPATEGETPLAVITRPRSEDGEGEVPELGKAPTQANYGINDASRDGESVADLASGSAADKVGAMVAQEGQIGSNRRERRAAEAKQQQQLKGEAAIALAASQSAQASDSIMPQAVQAVTSAVSPMVVDTSSKTANAKGVTTLRDLTASGAIPAAPVKPQPVNGITSSGNIVRTNARLLAQEEKRQAEVSAAQALKQDLDRILANVPGAYRGDVVRLEQYCVTMAPGRPISDVAGAAQQVALFRLLQNIINRNDTYFQPLFTAVLRIFRAHANGALSDTSRNRFDGHISLSREERRALQKITHLLALAADTKTRSMLRSMVDVDTALEDGLTEEGRSRVISFLQA